MKSQMSKKLAGLQEYAPIILTRLGLGLGLRLVNIETQSQRAGELGWVGLSTNSQSEQMKAFSCNQIRYSTFLMKV